MNGQSFENSELSNIVKHSIKDPLSKNERERLEFILNNDGLFESFLQTPTTSQSLQAFNEFIENCDQPLAVSKNIKTKKKPILAKKLGQNYKLSTKRPKRKMTVVSSKLKLQKKLSKAKHLDIDFDINSSMPEFQNEILSFAAGSEDLNKRWTKLQEDITNDNKNMNSAHLNNLRKKCEKNAKHIKKVQDVMKKLVDSLDHIKLHLDEADVDISANGDEDNSFPRELSKTRNTIKTRSPAKKITSKTSNPKCNELEKIGKLQKSDLASKLNEIDISNSESEFEDDIDELEELEKELTSIMRRIF